MRWSAAAAIAATFVGLAFSGDASASPGSPRALAVNIVRWNYAERFDRVWPTIHPRYRRLVGRRFWLMCKHRQYDELHAKVRVLRVRATSARSATLAYPRLGRVRVQTVRIRFDFHYLRRNYSQLISMDFTRVAGRWKGLWTTRELDAYSHGRCLPGT